MHDFRRRCLGMVDELRRDPQVVIENLWLIRNPGAYNDTYGFRRVTMGSL